MKRFRMISMVAMTILLLDLVVGSSTGNGSLLVGTAEAQTSASLTRGPYLQMGTPNSIVVRWRTGASTDSRVIYGLQPGALTQTASSSTSTTNHEITLQGLTPATRYYYAVGTSSQILAGGTTGFPFTTSPPAGTAQPTRVWVIGDAGTASSGQRSVRDAYTRFNQGGRTDLWLMLGDNAYSDGTDGQYQSAVFNMYPEMLRTAVVWPTLGNHDARSADSGTQSGPYYSIFTLPKRGEAGGLASGTEAYYSFDYGNIHFICLDSADSNRSTSGAMLKWLQADLTATDQNWIIAFWHHPPYSKGSHNSDSDTELVQMRQNALPILEQGGVDLVLSGHSHSYERSFLLDRHYGSSSSLTSAMKLDGGNGRVDGNGAYEKPSPGPAPHEGAVYVVAGSSGQTSGGSLNHPAMFASFNTLGSVALDVNGSRLDAKFIDSTGSVKDHFTILKGASTPVPPPAGPSELMATAVSSSRVDLAWRDNATNESGFHVDRCMGSGCTNFARVATLPANTTRYTDGALGAATTYRYQVSAFNSGGESNLSNASSATTLAPPPPPPPGQTLFQDDFEDGAAQGWTSAGGSWSVATDGTRVYQQSSASGDAVAGAGDPSWLDYGVETRVRPVAFNSAGGFAKVLARYKDANNYVYVLLRNTSILELKKKVNGTSVSLGTKSLSVTPGAWYTVKLELVGPGVKVWVNGTLQMEGTDPSPSGGMVGVGTYNASASFDDVVVATP